MWNRLLTTSFGFPPNRIEQPQHGHPYLLCIHPASLSRGSQEGWQDTALPFGKVTLTTRDIHRGGGKAAFELNPRHAFVIPDRAVATLLSASIIPPRISRRHMLREIHRVIAPGGCAIFCDVITRGSAMIELNNGAAHWLGCVPGSLSQAEYEAEISQASLKVIDVEVSLHRKIPEVESWCTALGLDYRKLAYPGEIFSTAMWTVVKPAARTTRKTNLVFQSSYNTFT